MPAQVTPSVTSGAAGQPPTNDPCSAIQPIDCSKQLPLAQNFQSVSSIPVNTRDSNGCALFIGCYVIERGIYYAWAGFAIGYAVVAPAVVQTATQQQQITNVYSPGAPVQAPQISSSGAVIRNCPPTLPDVSQFPEIFNDPTQPVFGQPFGFAACFVKYSGKYYAWSDQIHGYQQVYPTQVGGPSATIYNPQGVVVNPGNQASETTGAPNIVVNVPNQSSEISNIVAIKGEETKNAIEAGVEEVKAAIASGESLTSQAILSASESTNTAIGTISHSVDEALQTNLGAVQSMGESLTKSVESAIGASAVDFTPANDFFASAKDLIDKLASNTGVNILNFLTGGNTEAAISAIKSALDALTALNVCLNRLGNGEFKDLSDFEKCLSDSGLFGDGILALGVISAILSAWAQAAGQISAPFAQELGQLARANNPVSLLDLNNIIEAYKRSNWILDDTKLELQKQGLNDERISTILANAETLLDPGTLEAATLRGFQPTHVTEDDLKKLGFSDKSVGLITDLYSKIPPPTDLTRIADKRVWGLQTDPKYGQYAELPSEYVDLMKSWGYDEKYTNWLWAAHWNLPSPQQVFEMFHRGLISESDIQTYLGLTDWLPFFRDGLLGISYNALGRIDIKRAVNAGILNSDDALSAYKKLGYAESDAQTLVKIALNAASDNDQSIIDKLTHRAIAATESAYLKGVITPQQLEAELESLGLNPLTIGKIRGVLDKEIAISGVPARRESHQNKAVNYVVHAYTKGSLPYADALDDLRTLGLTDNDIANELAFAELERIAELKGEWAKHAIEAFSSHVVDYPGFQSLLASKGFNSTEIEQLGMEADMKREQRAKKPTEAQLHSLYKKKIITPNEFEDEMRGLGYADRYITWLAEL